MNDLCENVLEASVVASALGVIVLLLLFFAKERISPAWRYALLVMVVLRLLWIFPPSATTSWENVSPSLSKDTDLLESFSEAVGVAQSNLESFDSEATLLENERAPEQASVETVATELIAPVESSAVATAAPNLESNYSLTQILSTIWAVGCVSLLAVYLLSLIRLKLLIRSSDKLVEGEELGLLLEACAIAGIRNAPSLVVSDNIQSPAITGIFSTTIILPRNISSKISNYDLKIILLHELGHQRRKDLWVNQLMLAAQVLHWFNPLAWYFGKRTRIEAERACDAWVLSKLGESHRSGYGNALLNLMENIGQSKKIVGAVSVVESKNDLRARIKNISNCGLKLNLVSMCAVITTIVGLTSTAFTKSSATEKVLRPDIAEKGDNSKVNDEASKIKDQAVEAEPEEFRSMSITLKSKTYSFDGKIIPYDGSGGASHLEELREEIKKSCISKDINDIRIFCVGDTDISFLQDTADACRSAGVENVSIEKVTSQVVASTRDRSLEVKLLFPSLAKIGAYELSAELSNGSHYRYSKEMENRILSLIRKEAKETEYDRATILINRGLGDSSELLSKVKKSLNDSGVHSVGVWNKREHNEFYSTNDAVDVPPNLIKKAKMESIVVKVVDAFGKPIEGVKIHRSVWTDVKFKANADYLTSKDGIVTFEVPTLTSILRLWANKNGRVPMFANFDSREMKKCPLPSEFTFVLNEASTIGGYVKNLEGEPITGVMVEAQINLLRRHQDSTDSMGKPRLNTTLAYGAGAVFTDENGFWSLNNVTQSRVKSIGIKLRHKDYVDDLQWGWRNSDESSENFRYDDFLNLRAETVMDSGMKLKGRVTNSNGQPIEKAFVIWGENYYSNSKKQEVFTDKNGNYELPPISKNTRRITVFAKGYEPQMVQLEPSEHINRIKEFSLEKGKVTTISFVDEEGNPIPNVFVGVAGWRGVDTLINEKHPNVAYSGIPRKSDANGVYKWSWSPQAAVEYYIEKKGYKAVRDKHLAAGQHTIVLERN